MLRRFDTGERLLHWVNAAAFVVLAATGALMFVPALAAAVGNREVVRLSHDYAGYVAIAVPLLVLAGPWGRGLRRDLVEIDSLDDADRMWLREGWRDDLFGDPTVAPPQSKFNAGQKVNAVFTASATAVLAGTGLIMVFHRHFPLWLKDGANFVHTATAFVLTVAVAGHVVLALRDRGSMRGMVTGSVHERWAAVHHPRWVAASTDQIGDR